MSITVKDAGGTTREISTIDDLLEAIAGASGSPAEGVLSVQGVSGGTALPVAPGTDTPKGFVAIPDLSAAIGLGSIPVGATRALIQAETQDVRWLDDGQTPTASFGSVLLAGQSMMYTGSLSALKAIEVAASAKLNVSFYGNS